MHPVLRAALSMALLCRFKGRAASFQLFQHEVGGSRGCCRAFGGHRRAAGVNTCPDGHNRRFLGDCTRLPSQTQSCARRPARTSFGALTVHMSARGAANAAPANPKETKTPSPRAGTGTAKPRAKSAKKTAKTTKAVAASAEPLQENSELSEGSARIGGKRLVIVESPAKAVTIQRLLAEQGHYVVDWCAGHVRDLPTSATQVPASMKDKKWASLGIDVENGFQPLYVLKPGTKQTVDRLKKEAATASEVILATDEDREGEAISWHLLQLLKPTVPVKRAVFHEITAPAIAAAFEKPRDLDYNLVQAQEARRMVDRLAGYTMSPLLWRKIAPGLSAGRVQSVGMAMVVQRERARLTFKAAEYYDLTATLAVEAEVAGKKETFQAKLEEVNGAAVASSRDFDPDTGLLKVPAKASSRPVTWLAQDGAEALAQRLIEPGVEWKVLSVETKRQQRRPPVPFITSTLQQEAFNRLSLSPKQCMGVAQVLYEAGFITYMRTDNPVLSKEAFRIAKDVAGRRFGAENVAEGGAAKVKAPKGSQEAHEAIRPAAPDGNFRAPSETGLDGVPLRLYELVYARTVASVMTPAAYEQGSTSLQASISASSSNPTSEMATTATFRATGRRLIAPGFLKAYGEADAPEEGAGNDKAAAAAGNALTGGVESTAGSGLNGEASDAWNEGGAKAKAAREAKTMLPLLAEGQLLSCEELKAVSHSTQPPARFTEASFVKELDNCGVGRPSTYATILETLKERGYVTSNKGSLSPSLTAFVVTDLLTKYFPAFVDTAFTAAMEARLDDIAEGNTQRNEYLADYYLGDNGLQYQVNAIGEAIPAEEARRARLPALAALDESIGVYVGPYGPYILQKNETSTTASEANRTLSADANGVKTEAGSEHAAAELAAAGLSTIGSSDHKPLNGNIASLAREPAAQSDAAAAEAPAAAPRKRGRPAKGTTAAAAAAGKEPSEGDKAGFIKAKLPREIQYDVEGITAEVVLQCLEMSGADGQLIGYKPGTNQEVVLKTGPYGPYLELRSVPTNAWEASAAAATAAATGRPHEGSEEAAAATSPVVVEKRANLAKNEDVSALTLERALGFLALPRVVCREPESGEPITAGIARYGPFVNYRGSYRSVPPSDDVVDLSPERALELIEPIKDKPPPIVFGDYRGHGLRVAFGRYGPYLRWGTTAVKLPEQYKAEPGALSQEEAVEVVENFLSKGSKGPRKKTAAAKKAAPAKKNTQAEKAAPATRKAAAAELKGKAKRKRGVSRKGENDAADAEALVKRARSPFILFGLAKRPELKERLEPREIFRELGKLWEETLTNGEREAWVAAAAEDKARREREVAETRASLAPAGSGESSGAEQSASASSVGRPRAKSASREKGADSESSVAADAAAPVEEAF